MWMVSNLLYSTIIFIGGNVPDDVVSVAVISESGFEISQLRLKSLVFILIFASMERGEKKEEVNLKKTSAPVLSAYKP